jgi:hypothetical protein
MWNYWTESKEEEAPPPSPVVVKAATHGSGAVFVPSEFSFEARPYRVHFKNGCSGEYDGAALATFFPFDPREVESVQPVGGE